MNMINLHQPYSWMFHVEDVGAIACQCPDPHGGIRCEKILWYH